MTPRPTITCRRRRRSRPSLALLSFSLLAATTACGRTTTRLELRDGSVVTGYPTQSDRRFIRMKTRGGAVFVCKRDVQTVDLPGDEPAGIGAVLVVLGAVMLITTAANDDDAPGESGSFCSACGALVLAGGGALFFTGLGRWLQADDALDLGSPPHPACDPEAP